MNGEVCKGCDECMKAIEINCEWNTIYVVRAIIRCEERAMFSSLSMNRMASMPKMLEPMGRPSLWRKT